MEKIELNKLAPEAACKENPKWEQMISRKQELYTAKIDFRTEFQRDYTRILYSNAYKRLKHKTQVFFSPENDHICTRIEHVNHVESISYLLATAFGLNTELTKTISIAHDLGHSPFGHKGERVLNEILLRDTGKTFWHEENGLNYVDNIELLENREGYKENLNLTYAVRDGIISHCGEIDENSVKPRKEAIDLMNYTKPNEYAPFTWEGCIVKISDKISYLGRDIEDALRYGILTDSDIEELNQKLGFYKFGYETLNNTNIINYLNGDLLKNSSIEKGLTFSDQGLNLINEIKKFNYEKIYKNEKIELGEEYFRIVINTIYNILKEVYDNKIDKIIENPKSKLYKEVVEEFAYWLQDFCFEYDSLNNSSRRLKNNKLYDLNKKEDYMQAIVEYISGMTDNKVINTYNKLISF
ncbi:putative deoxyguanosinetriphosphate triphosphohydrolase [Clostridium sp. CAG:780]|nr:putative deoxyguanosinetriphosphate triphosphohydrolase [Clostridium sp. CAG:780]